jgi:hypothetical protein
MFAMLRCMFRTHACIYLWINFRPYLAQHWYRVRRCVVARQKSMVYFGNTCYIGKSIGRPRDWLQSACLTWRPPPWAVTAVGGVRMPRSYEMMYATRLYATRKLSWETAHALCCIAHAHNKQLEYGHAQQSRLPNSTFELSTRIRLIV